jgi:signal transduction histidine kinase
MRIAGIGDPALGMRKTSLPNRRVNNSSSHSPESVGNLDIVNLLDGWAGARPTQRAPARRAAAWVLAVAGPALITVAALSLWPSLVLGGFLFSALLVVIAVAVIGGPRPALATVVLGVLARVLFFAPVLTDVGRDMKPNPVSLAGFTIVGACVSILIGQLARLAQERASSGRIEAALRRVATLAAQAAPADELFAAVLEEAEHLLQADQMTMIRYASDGTSTVVASWRRTGDAAPPVGDRQQLGGTNLTTMIAQTCRPARIDTYGDASGAVAAAARKWGFHAGVGAPIIVQGRLWGAMIACTVDEHPLPPDTETRLASFTELVATAIANAESLAELTASRARVVTAADETRRRIERDLHDGAQQQLVSLGLTLHAARKTVPAQLGELDSDLAHVADGLASVLEDLQEIARGIHPAILAHGGLGPALKMLARRCSIPVELDVRTPDRLPEQIEVAAYYIVSEALTNATKHAQASLIHVDADAVGGALRLRIRDDGAGGADPVRGTGLVGLKDRIDALGGTITVQSPAGSGTSLDVELPLAG